MSSHNSIFEGSPVRSDFDQFRRVIRREATPSRVHYFEAYYDKEIIECLFDRLGVAPTSHQEDPYGFLRELQLYQRLGNDVYFIDEKSCRPVFDLNHRGAHTVAQSKDKVANGPIYNWETFEKYPWPEISKLDLRPLEWLEKHMPENMKCSSPFDIGWYKLLLGYEAICYLIYDEPELIRAVFDKLTGLFTDFANLMGQFSCVGVFLAFDDMGFKTQTMYSPEFHRQHNILLHQKCCEIAHRYNKMYFVHSCGNIGDCFDVLIDDVKIDAKHSFEDVILPIEKAKGLYGRRVGLLGGLDLDFLCRADKVQLQSRVRSLLETCAIDGGYAFGTGNSVAKYVPVENFLIALAEARKFSQENFRL